MGDTLTTDVVGRVLSAEMRTGVSKRTEKPYSIPEVELLLESFDKLTVTWSDGVDMPPVGAGVKCRVKLSGSGYGLEAKHRAHELVRLDGPLAAIPGAQPPAPAQQGNKPAA